EAAGGVRTGSVAGVETGALPIEQVSGSPYAITQGTLAANSNYTIAFTGANLAITAATLTVTANPQTKTYGTDDPTLTYGTSGLEIGRASCRESRETAGAVGPERK